MSIQPEAFQSSMASIWISCMIVTPFKTLGRQMNCLTFSSVFHAVITISCLCSILLPGLMLLFPQNRKSTSPFSQHITYNTISLVLPLQPAGVHSSSNLLSSDNSVIQTFQNLLELPPIVKVEGLKFLSKLEKCCIFILRFNCTTPPFLNF